MLKTNPIAIVKGDIKTITIKIAGLSGVDVSSVVLYYKVGDITGSVVGNGSPNSGYDFLFDTTSAGFPVGSGVYDVVVGFESNDENQIRTIIYNNRFDILPITTMRGTDQ